MLHLFLTGRRAAYMNDIFTVLHMPENTVYDLKYRIYESGDKNYSFQCRKRKL